MNVRLTKEEQNRLSLPERLILYYRKYPVRASKELFNVDLIWFQRKTLRSLFTVKYNFLLWGRGIGKTWIGALFCVLYAMLFPGVAIGIIAPSFKQTEFFFDKIDELYEKSPYFRASCYKKPLRATFKALVKFRNGSYIEGLPLGSGYKIRGRRYNIVWVDEYAYVNEDIIKLVVRPMMNVKKKGLENKYIISTSAYYTWNHAYNQYLLFSYMSGIKPELYAIHEYNDDDVNMVKDSPFELDKEIYDMMRIDSTEEMYQMEVKSKFPVETMGFFSAQLLDRCTPKLKYDENGELISSDSPIELEGCPNSKYVLGIDAARVVGGDNFSISILKIDGNIKRFVNNLTYNGISYQKMIDIIRKVVLKYNVVQINLDASGGGTTIKDLLSESYRLGDGRVLPPILDMEDRNLAGKDGMRILKMVNFTLSVVNDLYVRLKADLQHLNLLFPIDLRRHSDKELEKAGNEIIQTKRELLVLRAEGKGVYYSFDVPSHFHKDRATSLALANMAANEHLSGNVVINDNYLADGFWLP